MAMINCPECNKEVGDSVGLSMLLGLWVMGDIILGAFVLLTKPKV